MANRQRVRAQTPSKLTKLERLRRDLAGDKFLGEIQVGKRIGFYQIKDELGSGNFSKVKLGMHCLVEEKVAVKILEKSIIVDKVESALQREIRAMQRIFHPNIIQIFEVLEDPRKMYIVAEICPGGELDAKIRKEGKLDENLSKNYFQQIAGAVDYMHRLHIVHRDIKADNVFIAADDQVKLGDLGFCVTSCRDKLQEESCGSPHYCAPELFTDAPYQGECVDVWALGVMLYYMVTGDMPFQPPLAQLKRAVMTCEHQAIPEHVSASCAFVIRNVLRLSPSDRWSLAEIQRSAWLEGTPCTRQPAVMGGDTNRLDCSVSKLCLSESTTGATCMTQPKPSMLTRLERLGVTKEMLDRCKGGIRDDIAATYRVLLWHVDRLRQELRNEDERRHEEELRAINQKSSVCAIL